MKFDPAFPLLTKFSIGLKSTIKSEADVLAVAKYLGVELSVGGPDQRIRILADELQMQNGFLSVELEYDSIFGSAEYRKSMFIREVVANNRINRQKRLERSVGQQDIGVLRVDPGPGQAMMDFQFDPAFALLAKFMIGLPPSPKSEADVLAVANYIGVDLPDSSLDDRIGLLSQELQSQNGFLTVALSSDSIFQSDEYRRSMFIREVVANNRINLQKRLQRDR